MISQELNDTITRTGPGTDAGAVMRRYWQPAALSDELATNRPVVPVTLLGEKLVLFRDNDRPSLPASWRGSVSGQAGGQRIALPVSWLAF